MLFLSRIIGSILLISGTSIGAGMLGLPIKIIGINYYLNLVIFFLIWLIMLISAFAMLEISLWVKGDANIISISKIILGQNFCRFIAFLYILFLYSLITAYISGGSTMLIDLFAINSESYFFSFLFRLIFLVPFVIIMFLGINFVDYINRIFFLGLLVSYFVLSCDVFNLSVVDIPSLNFLDFKLIFFALPIMVTSFGYSLLIPSLKLYLFNNVKLICIVIFVGSLIPFVVYVFWEYLVYGFFVNVGNKLFIQTLFGQGNPTEKLIILISNNNNNILYVILAFSFFALSSSLLGVSLGIYDFFFDLLNISKVFFLHKMFVLCLVFCFPLIFCVFSPYGFMLALSYAGIFASILLILFPIYVLWYGRYVKKIKYVYILFDNKYFLFFIFFVGLGLVFIDFVEKSVV